MNISGRIPSLMLAKISGIVYLAAAGMLYGLWRLWRGEEPFGTSGSEITDAEIQQGWEDEPEASTGYQSTVLITGRGSYEVEDENEEEDDTEDESSEPDNTSKRIGEYDSGDDTETPSDGSDSDSEEVQVTGTVLGVGEEITLDTSDGEVTVTGGSDLDVRLGQSITVRGTRNDDGTIAVSEMF